ncbi:MAG: hypothetical protein K6E33_02680, partial [Lachnospiraceae bacterium]|nr:hypothetical protein [Lachnospiraceae bacterium]
MPTTVSVNKSGTTLTEGTDYTLTYTNNVDVCDSTATNAPTVTATGKGKFSGSISREFSITEKTISDNDVTLDSKYAYTGKAVEPAPVVTVDGTTLTKGTDYTVTYTNNVNKGTATAKIVGKGNYTGTVTKTFQIVDMPVATITILGTGYSSLQTSNAVGGYVKAATTATITTQAPTKLPVKTVEYFQSNTFYSTSSALESAASWKTYSNATSETTANSNNYFYARVAYTDQEADTNAVAGYVYASTKNIIDDRKAPTAVIDSASVNGVTATVKVSGVDPKSGSEVASGIDKYYLVVKKTGEAAPTADYVVQKGASNTTGEFSVSNLSTTQTYVFYAVTVDKAGNMSTVASSNGVLPKGSVKVTIGVMGHTYNVLQGKDEIDDYTKETKEITINTESDVGIKSVQYYIADKHITSESEIENAASSSGGSTTTTSVTTGSSSGTTVTTSTGTSKSSKWSTYNSSSKPWLKKNQLNYIYAKVTLNDNNSTVAYVSSKGIWEDEKVPTTSSISTTPSDTSSAATVKGTDKESGIKTYYLLAKKATDAAPSKPADVKSGGLNSTDGKFTISGLTASTKYNLYAVIEDKAGNLSAIKTGKLTTTKAKTDATKKAAAAGAGAGAGAGASGNSSGNGSNISKRTAGASGNSVSDGNAAGAD